MSVPLLDPEFRLSVEKYHTMIDAGILTDDDRVELLEEFLVQKSPVTPAHRISLSKISKNISSQLSTDWFIQLHDPITLADGEPEPDASVVRGKDEDYANHHPGPDDVSLVVEVSDSTLARDRGIKLRSYARASISQYWIVDLVSRRVEVYTNPNPKTSSPNYDQPQIFDETMSLPLTINGKKLGQIAVADILP